jgi:Protein of unknown function (DUF3500)
MQPRLQARIPTRPQARSSIRKSRRIRVGGLVAIATLASASVVMWNGNVANAATTKKRSTTTTKAAIKKATTKTTVLATTVSTVVTGATVVTTPDATNSDLVGSAVTASNALLGGLSETQRKAITFKFDDLAGKENSWSNFPYGAFKGRQGVRLGELNATQRAAAMTAVQSVLSEKGYAKVLGILASDDYTGAKENSGPGGVAFGSDYYYLAFYGTPSATTPWTLQFGGHHLAIHVTIGGSTISQTPLFTGTDPIKFTFKGTDYQPMLAETNAVFGVIKSFDAKQSAAAKLTGINDLVAGPGVDFKFPAPEGLKYTDLTADLQAKVRALITLWTTDTNNAISKQLQATYESQLNDTRIAWAGSSDPTANGGYLRIDGPRLWIEYVTTGRSGEISHCHTVYRDKKLDYGNKPA